MNFETKLIDNISQIKRPKIIFSSGRVNHFDGNIIYCDPFPAPIGSKRSNGERNSGRSY